VEGLGSPGQIRKVKSGYARNYLIPNKMARIQRGKQSGSVHPLVAAASARPGLETERLGVEDDIAMREKAKMDEATRRKKLEAVVKKLTQATVVRFVSFGSFLLLQNCFRLYAHKHNHCLVWGKYDQAVILDKQQIIMKVLCK